MEKPFLYVSIIAGAAAVFGLIAALAAVTVALHSPNMDTANRTLSLVTNIRNNVSSPTSGLQVIKNDIDTKATQSSVNAVSTQLQPLVAQTTKAIIVNNETGHGQIWLHPVTGITYRGHVTLNTADYPICKQPDAYCFPDPVMIICGLPGSSSNPTSTTFIQVLSASPASAGQNSINQDFSCLSLSEDGISNTTGIYGVIHYVEVKT